MVTFKDAVQEKNHAGTFGSTFSWNTHHFSAGL